MTPIKRRLQEANSQLQDVRTGRSIQGQIPKLLGRDLEEVIWGGLQPLAMPLSLTVVPHYPRQGDVWLFAVNEWGQGRAGLCRQRAVWTHWKPSGPLDRLTKPSQSSPCLPLVLHLLSRFLLPHLAPSYALGALKPPAAL